MHGHIKNIQMTADHLISRYPFIKSVRHIFEIDPCAAPRMTQSDKWRTNPNHPDPRKRQRECVRKYFAFRNELQWLCKQQKYTLEPTIKVVFVVAMPEKSWSKKKRLEMFGEPMMSKPDVDNCCKSFFDSFGNDDGFVWNIHAIKIWGSRGMIIIFE